MRRFKKYLFLFICFWNYSLAIAQNKGAIDTANKGPYKPKPYNEIIKPSSTTDDGLFKVHKVIDRYFFEIPDSLFERDIFIVNRIAKAGSDTRGNDTPFGYAGDEIGRHVIRFSKGPSYKVFIKDLTNTFYLMANDSSENGLNASLSNSNIAPIVNVFEIKAFSPDSSGVVLDVTDFINGENTLLFVNADAKFSLRVASFQADKSYIENVKSLPLNIELRAIKTYTRKYGEGFATYELNSSLVLLPKEPMKPRYFDQRVGYFHALFVNFDMNPQHVETVRHINRWRLEPKNEDIEKYKRGELVEPKKPIVYYIDPATPKKWIPYLIQGVNDWQKAFEKAGFRNAIFAREAPVDDPEWSLEDARHNAIVYKPSEVQNASGPMVFDPRSGEIIESHINWFHNVLQLLKDWYFIQVSSIDSNARKPVLADSLMGRLIRYVCAHEVGHTLGLMHNFGASSSVKVENLRNKKWVEENGICPSIMDYARFNYVAQPEDSIGEKGILPKVGPYDEWAIEWGYKWLPDLVDPQKEKEFLNRWIIAKTDLNKELWFGNESNSLDPRTQSEDLGDNPVKASFYGIKNLKRTVKHLIEWTTQKPEEDYDKLSKMYNGIFNQYKVYLFHVATVVGGVMLTPKTKEQRGPVLEYPTKIQQKQAVNFLHENIFTTPTWVMENEIYSLTGVGGVYKVVYLQKSVLEKILSQTTLGNLLWWSTYQPGKAYTPQSFFEDLEKGIWKELNGKAPIDIYRRNLQKVYVDQIISLLNPPINSPHPNVDAFYKASLITDISSIVKQQIRVLVKKINVAISGCSDSLSKYHLIDVRDRLKVALQTENSK